MNKTEVQYKRMSHQLLHFSLLLDTHNTITSTFFSPTKNRIFGVPHLREQGTFPVQREVSACSPAPDRPQAWLGTPGAGLLHPYA